MKGSTQNNPLIFFDFATHYGGSYQCTVRLIERLKYWTDIVVIDVYGSTSQYVSDLEKAKVPLIVLFPEHRGRITLGGKGFNRLFILLYSSLTIVRVIFHLNRIIRELKPRAIWVNSEKALFVSSLAIRQKLPLAVHVHTELKRIKKYCLFAWRRADLVIGVSKLSLKNLRNIPSAKENMQVIYNGIDIDRTTRQAEVESSDLPPRKPGDIILVFPASMGSPLKGHVMGIKAIAKYVNTGGQAQLWICGDIPPGATNDFYNHIRQLVVDLNLQEYVHFLGWRNDIFSVITKSDIVILPSFSEGFPLSLLEAMALGKPIISTRVGGVPELVRDEVDGILVDPGDPDAIVRAIRKLEDPVTRGQMGQAGQERASYFSLDTQARQFLDAMNNLVESRS